MVVISDSSNLHGLNCRMTKKMLPVFVYPQKKETYVIFIMKETLSVTNLQLRMRLVLHLCQCPN